MPVFSPLLFEFRSLHFAAVPSPGPKFVPAAAPEKWFWWLSINSKLPQNYASIISIISINLKKARISAISF